MIYQRLFKIEVLFFFVKSSLIGTHLFYEYLVRQSVCQATKGRNVEIKKHSFLGGYLRQRADSFFCVKSCLIGAHLFYEYFVRQSVGQATKGRNVYIIRIMNFFLFAATL